MGGGERGGRQTGRRDSAAGAWGNGLRDGRSARARAPLAKMTRRVSVGGRVGRICERKKNPGERVGRDAPAVLAEVAVAQAQHRGARRGRRGVAQGSPAAEAQTTRAATSAAARDPRRVASVARGRRNKHPRSRDADDWRTCRTSKSAPPGTTTGGLACQSTKTTGVGAR